MLREEPDSFGRKLSIKLFFCHKVSLTFFCHNESQFNINPFLKKFKFNPGRNDAAIEFYLSQLEEDILSLDKKISREAILYIL